MPFRWTPERLAARSRMAAAVASGESVADVATRFGVGPVFVRRACAADGVVLRPGRKPTLPEPEPRACAQCGTVFTPPRKKWRRKFCSIPCSGRAFCNPEHNRRVGRENREKISDANRSKRPPAKGYRKYLGRHEHRVVMERKLGRPLSPGEIVHHDNELKWDNDPPNLVLLPNQAEHARLHARRRAAPVGRVPLSA